MPVFETCGWSTPPFRWKRLLAFLVSYILTPTRVKLMASLAITIFCFPLILSSILVLNDRGGGWLELRSPSVERILRLYTRLLVWAPQIFSGV